MRNATTTLTSLLLAGVVALAATPATAQVTDVTLPHISGSVGERVPTDLRLENAPGITGVTLEIAYDPALVTPDVDITLGGLGDSLPNLPGANIVSPGLLRIGIAVIDDTGYVGSGVLATIEWDLLAGGFAPLAFNSVLLEDNQSPPALPSNPVNGSITIAGGPGGSCPCPPDEPRVIVSNAQGRMGDRISVDIDVQQIVTTLDAFGLVLEYDPTVLQYVTDSGRCIDLTSDWFSCDAAETTPGMVTIGGFNTTQIPAGSTGGIARVEFDVICSTCVDDDTSLLTLTGLVDDLAGMDVCCGTFTYGQSCLSDGDVNLNGVLSPGDAQCAFNMFFNNQVVTDDCRVDGTCEAAAGDVNCDRTVTPGDALAIFTRWLENGAPDHCFSEGVPRAAGLSRGDEALYRLDVSALATRAAGVVRVPVVMRGRPGGAAFGVEISFDPSRLELTDLVLAEAGADWREVKARAVAPGHVVVGGYDAFGLAEEWQHDGEVLIFELEFDKRAGDPGAIEVRWVEQLIGAAATVPGAGQAAPPGFRLGRMFPNPTRGVVAGSLVVPENAGRAVRVVVYDVHGRQVQTVLDGVLTPGFHQIEWDRRTVSGDRARPGIYFIRLTAGSFTTSRKITVLD